MNTRNPNLSDHTHEAKIYLQQDNTDLYKLVLRYSKWKHAKLWIVFIGVLVAFGFSTMLVLSKDPINAFGTAGLEDEEISNEETVEETIPKPIAIFVFTSILSVIMIFTLWTVFIREIAGRQGKKLFYSWQTPIRELLCNQAKLCDRIDDPSLNDNVNLVIVVADIITVSQLKIPAPPVLIGTLVVRIGIRSFCGCKDSE